MNNRYRALTNRGCSQILSLVQVCSALTRTSLAIAYESAGGVECCFVFLCACRTMFTYKMYTRKQHKIRNIVFPFHRSPSFPFPIQFYMHDVHEQNRFKRCIVCAKQVSRQDYRKTLRKCKKKKWDGKERCVLESPSLLARVKHDIPDYSETNRALHLAASSRKVASQRT